MKQHLLQILHRQQLHQVAAAAAVSLACLLALTGRGLLS
jgi:hypothetical protein